MNANTKNTKLGLLLFGTLLMIFGIFIFVVNITLLYQGKNAVRKEELIEVNDATTIPKNNVERKATSFYDDLASGEKIGKLYIPRLEISIPIYHGTSNNELKKGIGHVIGTALPGENSNSVLTGHRETVFQPLEDIKKGDLIKVESEKAIYSYLVRKIRIVDETDQTVIKPKRKSTLTLVTCYPFTYVGLAPQRYVVVADLVSSKVRRI